MDKSPDAFRTISEVAELLETPAHVLRFWESRFPQIRPVKRAGGRRYYRPADVALLIGIKRLLHEEGLTIRGVQKILREQGVRHVADPTGDAVTDAEAEDAEAALEAALSSLAPDDAEPPLPHEEAESAQVVALETALRRAPVQPRRPVQENLFASLFDDTPAAEPPAPAEETAQVVPLPGVTAPPPVLDVPEEPVPDAPFIEAEPEDADEGALPPSAEVIAFADPAALAPEPTPPEQPAEELAAEDLAAAAAMIAGLDSGSGTAFDAEPDESPESEPAAESPLPLPADAVALDSALLAALVSHLSALPPGRLHPQRAALKSLLRRLSALEDRLAEPIG